MFFQQVYDKSLAQASYVIGCQVTGEAMVVDAKRDVDTYLELAKQHGLTITKVTETHIHADFLSGTRELAKLTGAEIYLSDEGGQDWQYEFPHTGLKDGDQIHLGNISFRILHNPGHTPESISFLITDHPASDHPVIILTGDFVFVGDVGRPDLLEKAAGIVGSQSEGAEQMFQSLQKFSALPDFVQLWPGHGAGSACGKSLGAVSSSTIGYEKIRNWALEDASRQDFIQTLLAGQPEPPRYFAQMKKLNKIERSLLLEVPQIPLLSDSSFIDLLLMDVQLVDTRSKFEFSKEFIAGAYNIQANNAFATWCGWMLDYDRPIVLIAQKNQLEDLMRKLMRIGLDNVVGYIPSIDTLDVPMNTYEVLSFEEFAETVHDQDTQVYDVRNQSEFENGHVEGAKNIFVGTMINHLDEIDQTKSIVLYCQSGDRAALASSILLKNGFENIRTYFGGMKEWKEKQQPLQFT
ncbi:MBL fold metallo-hydrolase [Sphingobacterium hungaricum]|uniref:MBL fold metallo-hydrolase n=1 Tax=Sphingobacterium hungaricum TaxID=2082723 RepID=A0A928YRJ9_9SPHI|nr:MBL fold metallo-hydrolase [Sphingobacterium hungaricum]MBE8713398.1 MBL fold metallo-hydrolase [Sphingobacterium hungaricum]